MIMKISGIEEVNAALAELPQQVSKATVKKALVEAGEPMAEIARGHAARRTGKLARAIGVFKTTAKSQKQSRVKVTKDVADAYVGVGYRRGSAGYAPHAHLVEYGTGPRFQKSGRFVGQMPAQPFMRPAYDTDKAAFIGRISAAILKQIDRAKARLARKSGARR